MKMFVKPVAGLIVLGPDGEALPEDGKEVEATSFWLRRIVDGDVVKEKPKATGDK